GDECLGQLIPELRVYDGEGGIVDLDEERVDRRLVERVERDGHGADADGAEEHGREGGRVVEDEEDPLLPAQAELGEGPAGGAGHLELPAAADRLVSAAAGGVTGPDGRRLPRE